GDLDGDGDLDAVTVSFGDGSRVWLNDGAGFFSDSGQWLESATGREVELGDFDGDFDLDIYVRAHREPDRIWLNDGHGQFSDRRLVLHDDGGSGVVLADADGDYDLDVWIFGTNGQIYLNVCGVDLAVSKTGTPAVVQATNRLIYTVAVTNLGPSVVSNVVVADHLPDGVSFSASLPLPDGMAGGSLTWLLGDLPVYAGWIATIAVEVDTNTTGSLTNRVVLTSDGFDVRLGNNTGLAVNRVPDTDLDMIADLFDADDDGDNMSDADELVANTDPLDPTSCLFLTIEPGSNGTINALQFPSSTGRFYHLERRLDLTTGDWGRIQTNIPGTGEMIDLIGPNSPSGSFFRIVVERP
ncbi:MAG: DUF11 domain-containing protein, partial [Verrucomicrobiota bacterium]